MNGVYIIGEIGCEHLGETMLATQLIEILVAAGADCAKFQYFTEKEVGSQIWKKVGRYRLNFNQLNYLKNYCKEAGIDFLCSAFGMDSLYGLSEMYCSAIKIPSVKNEDFKFIDKAAELFKKGFISLGMTKTVVKRDFHNFKSLLCTSAYPCPFDQVNLKVMTKYKLDGISDHTLGWTVPVAATALGAKVIEKHITLSGINGGPDSRIALEPLQFVDMCHKIRNTELALGDGIKKIESSEKLLLWRKKQQNFKT